MNKNCLTVELSIIAVVLLILSSLTNVVGYQTVKSLNPQFIDEQEQKEKSTQSPNSECGCGDSSETTEWKFPVICTFANIIMFITLLLIWSSLGYYLFEIAATIIETFNCWP